MVQIEYRMNDWHIPRSRAVPQVYEGENNVTEIFISCEPDSGCEYQLHRILNGKKEYIVMEPQSDGLHCILTQAFLSADGEVTMQLRGVYEDGRIKESNKFYFRIGDSINATEKL